MPEFDEELIGILKQGAKALCVNLNDLQINSFLTYLRELKEWNRKINLTSINDDREIIIRHFLDSLTPFEYLQPHCRLLDIGSGAGFPGIPLKIAAPSLKITLIDSSMKKVAFQRHIIRTLKLADITAIHGRIGEPGKTLGISRFDIVISRALRHVKDLLLLGRPYLKKEGLIIAIKGVKGLDEIRGLSCGETKLWKAEEKRLPFSHRKTILLLFRRDVSRETLR